MKFRYTKYPSKPSPSHPTRKSVLRPVIPIRLIYQDNHSPWYDSLIDSGADYCIFHAEMGELIGMDVKKGKLMDFVGISGKPQKAYFHNIAIEIGGLKYECYAGFSYDIETLPYGILGQDGFFNLFIVIFDLKKRSIELIRK